MINRTILTAAMVGLTAYSANAQGFNVTSSGEANFYGFYLNDKDEYGFGFDSEFSIKLSQYMADGAEAGGFLSVETPDKVDAYLFYSSFFGEARLGSMDIDNHGAMIPDAVDAPDAKDYSPDFAVVNKQSFGDLALPDVRPTFTYASPKFGGFGLGIGLQTDQFDAAIAGSVNSGSGMVSVGLGYGAQYDDMSNGNIKLGAGFNFNDNEIAANINHSLAENGTTALGLGGKVKQGNVTYGLNYQAGDIASPSLGITSAGVGFSEGYISVGGSFTLDHSKEDEDSKFSAGAGAKYEIGSVSLGSHAEYNFDDSTFAVDGGVDYSVNDRVSIGAGISRDHNEEVGGAAGVSVKF